MRSRSMSGLIAALVLFGCILTPLLTGYAVYQYIAAWLQLRHDRAFVRGMQHWLSRGF